ncbi:hypothetical protein JCM3770_004431 [Rhodotorula araucariae]
MTQAATATPPTSLLDHTLRTAPLAVVYGTLASTGLGAAAGAATGVIRDQPAIPAAFKTALRTGVFSFTFFSIREYAVIPLLTHFALHPSPLPPPPGSAAPPPLPRNPHTANLVPTTLAGLVAGTAFSAQSRPGPLVALHARAGLTLALGCAVLQGIVNEADLIRLRMLLWGEERARARRFEASLETGASAPAPASPGQGVGTGPGASGPAQQQQQQGGASLLSDWTHQSAATAAGEAPADPGRETFSERSDRLIGEAWAWAKRQAGALSPVTKLDEGEYERRLEERLRGVDEQRERTRREREELELVGARLAEQQRLREGR